MADRVLGKAVNKMLKGYSRYFELWPESCELNKEVRNCQKSAI